MKLKEHPATSVAAQRISAMQVIQGENGSFRMGLLTQLELTPETVICGPGFNEATVRIRSSEHFYFVFREDLSNAGFAAADVATKAAMAG